LMYILSESDHRLHYVEQWASERHETLKMLIGCPFEPVELSDDRLGRILELFSKDNMWLPFHESLNKGVVLSYSLEIDTVRHDSTTINSYGLVDENGLLQLGYSKDHRPDLGQLKLMYSTLDPMALPVYLSVVEGNKADDPLYIPAIAGVEKSFGKGLLHVGDCKMGSLPNRGQIVSMGHDYLCPLSQLQREDMDIYLQPVIKQEVVLTPIERTYADGETRVIAEGYTHKIKREWELDSKKTEWTERQLVVRSFAYADSGKRHLEKEIEKTCKILDELLIPKQGKKRLETLSDLETKVEKIFKEHGTLNIIKVNCHEKIIEKKIRAYKNRPERVERISQFSLKYEVDKDALKKAVNQLGWRIYGTSASEDRLSLIKAVLEYRHEYRIENNFSRLKGKSLSLKPMYLQRDDRRVGLIRLLTLALYPLTLIQYQIRKELKENNDELKGLHGNIRTNTPTTERILKSFGNIHLTIVKTPQENLLHVTDLTPVQIKILKLLKIGSPKQVVTANFYCPNSPFHVNSSKLKNTLKN